MKISYITGINAPNGQDGMGRSMPKTFKFNGVGESFLIGSDCCCHNKSINGMRIGDDSVPSYHKGSFNAAFDNGLDWYRVRRVQDNGAKELSVGAITEWRAKQALGASFRAAFLAFIKGNGGGIATSMYNGIFRVNPRVLPIPTSAKVVLNQTLAAYAKQIGVRLPTDRESQAIRTLAQRGQTTLSAGSGSGYTATADLSKFSTNTATPLITKEMIENVKKAYEQILGSGQYELNMKYLRYLDEETAKLTTSYTIPAATEKAKKEFADGMQVQWFWMGGNPEDLIGAILEGNQKSPRGRDANYMLMTAKTRGLQAKDIGLIIRGFASGFAGNKFDWGSSSTYIFGTEKGIGLTGAEIAAWVSANLPLILQALALVGAIYKAIKGIGESGVAKREIDKLLSEGYVTQEDFLGFPIPRPVVLEVKNFEIPTTELDGAAILDVALTLAGGSAKAQELKQEAAADPQTNKFLEKAVALGGKVQPSTGNTIITLVKIDPNRLDPENGAFQAGGMILPLLIGVGVVMALNTAKKQK